MITNHIRSSRPIAQSPTEHNLVSETVERFKSLTARNTKSELPTTVQIALTSYIEKKQMEGTSQSNDKKPSHKDSTIVH